jgi:CelD/BcsL family acetyltransferase involved in cellulose biosynthesis
VKIEISHDLDAVQDVWRQVAAQTDNIFATWEWASTWWRHLGRGLPTIAIVRVDGELRGILPLYRSRSRPLRIVRFIGHGPADQLGPICAPADLPVMVAALHDLLAEMAPWDIFLAEVLPGGHPWGDDLGGVRLLTESSPFMELAGLDWTSFLAGRSRNFRSQLQRRERNLSAEGQVAIRGTTDLDSLEADLDSLFRLHHARWGFKTEFSRLESFHREFAAFATRNGWLRLWILDLNGESVAAWYGFHYGSVYSYYQQGRDPSQRAASLGTMLLTHTIREAINEHAGTYGFLRGNEPYKFRFADRDMALVTIGLPRSAAGAAALRTYVLAVRLAGRLRRLGARLRR